MRKRDVIIKSCKPKGKQTLVLIRKHRHTRMFTIDYSQSLVSTEVCQFKILSHNNYTLGRMPMFQIHTGSDLLMSLGKVLK